MIFENHPIFVSTESVLRKIAQTLRDLYYILMKNLGAAAETVLRKCAQTLKDLYYIFMKNLGAAARETVLRKFAQTLKDLYYILMKMSKKWLIFIKL